MCVTSFPLPSPPLPSSSPVSEWSAVSSWFSMPTCCKGQNMFLCTEKSTLHCWGELELLLGVSTVSTTTYHYTPLLGMDRSTLPKDIWDSILKSSPMPYWGRARDSKLKVRQLTVCMHSSKHSGTGRAILWMHLSLCGLMAGLFPYSCICLAVVSLVAASCRVVQTAAAGEEAKQTCHLLSMLSRWLRPRENTH